MHLKTWNLEGLKFLNILISNKLNVYLAWYFSSKYIKLQRPNGEKVTVAESKIGDTILATRQNHLVFVEITHFMHFIPDK